MKQLLLGFSCWIVALTGFSQQSNQVPITLETPSNTVYVHLYYLQDNSYRPDLAAQTLYGVEDSTQAVRLAIQLKQILDGSGLYVRIGAVPQNPNYQDTLSQNQVYTLFPKEFPEIYVEKVEGSWYYSEETINNIPRLHKKVYPFGSDILLNNLPKISQNKLLGLYIWQYIGLAILLLAGLLLYSLLSRIFNPLVRRLSESRLYPSLISSSLVWRIARLFSILVVLRLFKIFLPPLQLPPATAQFAIIVIKVISTALVVLIAFRILDIFITYANKYTKKTESKMDEQLMPIIQRSLQTVILLGGLIQVLTLFNINVTTLIAGLSIGGLALALAAQDTLKNLFGSLTIFMDKPFQIGDWIQFSGIDGTVEEVGFRSTRVRTFESSLVYVPNGKLADMIVNNYGLRIMRRFKTNVTLTYDTSAFLIETYVKGIREILETHPSTSKDRINVSFNNMGASSLDILVYTFFDVPDYATELHSKQEILLAIIQLAEQLGIEFAFPSSTVYVESFPGQQKLNKDRHETPEKIDANYAEFMKEWKGRFEQ